MRVVAGSAGGVALHVPKSKEVRPTMDMVKGAIFSSLGDAIHGARVLDLFAGTGALGIEALSRGAASAVFVEKDRLAMRSIERNLEKTRLSGALHALDVFRFLDRLTGGSAFDFIFADPPYPKPRASAILRPSCSGAMRCVWPLPRTGPLCSNIFLGRSSPSVIVGRVCDRNATAPPRLRFFGELTMRSRVPAR